MMTILTARPEAITFDPQQSALIVVDMQNAYATPGGYLDLAGFDVSTTRPVIANIQTAVTAARAAGMLIIWFQNGWDEQYVEAGGPGSPNFHKSNALKTMRKQPQLQGKLLAKGSWDYQLVDELVPQPGDIVLPKPRYSGFFNTPLDSILRSRGIRHLVSPVSLPTSASNRRYATAFFWSISAWCWKTQHTRRGRNLHRRPRCSISKPFLAGSATSKRSATPLSPTSFARIA
ncbi:isochorismatase family protein ycdL [Escherichia coli]|uniref:Isochorismatase family protein ycdL n=1 Tax=Escherichia coli TaxID=562 RepID=A0A3S4KUJ9_ECOLX|nr:isochorismatase family protein ycdL [Escherichia coli]